MIEIKFYNQWKEYNIEEKIDIFELDIEWFKRNVLMIELSVLGFEIDIYIGD